MAEHLHLQHQVRRRVGGHARQVQYALFPADLLIGARQWRRADRQRYSASAKSFGGQAMSVAAAMSEAPGPEKMPGSPMILIDKVNKWFGALHVLRDVSLTVAEGERVVVCGPSGSGKSTIIRCIN